MWRKKLRKTTAGILAALMVFGSLQIVTVEQVYAEETNPVTTSGNAVSGNGVGNSARSLSRNAVALGQRVVTENVLSDYNTSFEGANDAGNLWWWNDASWGQTNIPRRAYGEAAKPAADCGDYYVQANPANIGDKAQCQIAGGGIAALIKGGKTYEYSYYAKLAEGEIAGAVTLSVIGDWSTSAVMTPDKEVTLNADEWQKVTGTFTLASDASQVVVRFEGTAGVSFCLDDLRVAEVVETQEEDRVITSNILSDYNTSFEGANDAGNLWWWNDASWGQTNIPRRAYGEAAKPAADCGDYYVQANPANIGDKAQCQIAGGGIAALIKGGKTYEYSYYAKLAEGGTAGAVTLSVIGDWSTSAVMTPDKEVTLNADEWQKVTGTFTLASDASQVVVRFEGTEGVAYCIDDLRVGELSEGEQEQLGDNIIQNPDFADASDEGMAVWKIAEGNSTITAEVSDTAIFDDVKTYGKISRDPASSSTQDCFSQDITAVVEKGAEYQFEFYAMLSDEYADAPENQRKVEFCPYITAGGSTNYLGTYSSELTGNSSQALTPGEWTKYSGTFTIAYTGELEKVAIRIIEQGTNYGQGDCVKGDYYITGMSMRKIVKEKPEIEQDIPDFKDSITSDLGVGTLAGTAVTASEMKDETLMELVTKHFNAVTLGNELKLDAMLNYQNSKCPEDGTETVTFNGQQLLVPVLNHSRADGMLDVILDWNNEHPEDTIKVRGHVLVWHSQAPEWFFKENYDIDADFVSKEVMDQRLEWYIKTMLEYYTGQDSKYKDLFYGWDVVNEAINDGTATYRSASESSWAAVYGSQSNEYIIKAFRWANKYAPADLELYYNDYNECVPSKCEGIVKLLQAVKDAEGTRIDGMGMQAHYNMDSPSIAQFEAAIRAYAAVVGKVQLTELDLKASSAFDGTDATREEEYTKQAYRYKAFYDTVKALNAEEGIEVSGITIWGVVDKYSWLQSSSSVGGGADGTQTQCPLLFDDDYRAKPAFWAFVNPNMLEPATKKLTVVQDIGTGYESAEVYTFGDASCGVTFRPIWSGNTLKVQVTVKDAVVDAADSITLYVDAANSKAESITPQKVTINRKDTTVVPGGYQAELSAEVQDAAVAKKIGFDIRVANGSTLLSYNDLRNTQDTSSKYYAEATYKPYALVGNGTAVVDGEKEAVWTKEGQEIPFTINLGSKVTAKATALWDENYLYVFAEVKDADLNHASANAYEQDSLEVFIDENNHKSDSYEDDDKQYRISYINEQSFNGKKCVAENVTSVAKTTADGYVIEAAYKWTDITPKAGMEIGLEFQINDADSTGKRIGTLSWYDETGMGWSAPAVYGTVKLVGEPDVEPTPEPTPTPTPTPQPSPDDKPSDEGAQSGDSGATVTPAPSATPAPSVRPTARPVVSPAPSEISTMPAMPEEVKQAAERLSALLDRNATVRQKREAAQAVIEAVKQLAENSNLQGFAEDAIQYAEELISKALNKQVNVEYSGENVPEVSKVIGALVSVDAEKETKLSLVALGEDEVPAINEKYVNGYALDIKLFADEEAIQPVVPVTIRMQLPDSIDKNKEVKVLHFGEGASEPDELEAAIFGNEVEFTTSGFSTFVVVNVADNEQPAEEKDNKPVEEIQEGSEAVEDAGQATEASAEQGSNTTIIIVVVVIVVVIALAIGITIAVKSKKDDELE